MNSHLLIIEDDASLNAILAMHFAEQGYTVTSASSVAEALARMKDAVPDVAVVDHKLPDGTGLELLNRMQEQEPDLAIIMITGLHDLDLAVRAIQQGAFDFIHKPIQIQELGHVIQRALEHRRLVREVTAWRNGAQPPASRGEMIGQSRAMLKISKEIALVANSDVRVLLTGESGTGKELVARAIHSHSNRPGPFLAVNCAAIVENLLESELFGHEKGAFTGAVARKAGKFELAAEGTLFLDEVGELAPPLQAKLLRVLQDGVFERVGGTQQLNSRVRIIAATNRDLHSEAQAGNFREDLLYRLNVLHIHIPPLRERREDIPLLVQGLMAKLAHALHRKPLQITEAALTQLMDYAWPGNIREMENVLTQAIVRARDTLFTPALLPLQPVPPAEPSGIQQDPFRTPQGRLLSLEELESHHIQRVLQETGYHKGRTCEILGISRPALERKILKYGLQMHRFGVAG